MAKDANWRFDPFTNLFNYQPISGERQTVSFLDEWGIYGFILDESPRIQSGSDALTVKVDENDRESPSTFNVKIKTES